MSVTVNDETKSSDIKILPYNKFIFSHKQDTWNVDGVIFIGRAHPRFDVDQTSHAFTRGRESARTVRNGTEVVCVRHFLICGRWPILHCVRLFANVNVNKVNVFVSVSYSL